MKLIFKNPQTPTVLHHLIGWRIIHMQMLFNKVSADLRNFKEWHMNVIKKRLHMRPPLFHISPYTKSTSWNLYLCCSLKCVFISRKFYKKFTLSLSTRLGLLAVSERTRGMAPNITWRNSEKVGIFHIKGHKRRYKIIQLSNQLSQKVRYHLYIHLYVCLLIHRYAYLSI